MYHGLCLPSPSKAFHSVLPSPAFSTYVLQLCRKFLFQGAAGSAFFAVILVLLFVVSLVDSCMLPFPFRLAKRCKSMHTPCTAILWCILCAVWAQYISAHALARSELTVRMQKTSQTWSQCATPKSVPPAFADICSCADILSLLHGLDTLQVSRVVQA